ncbi:MAG: DUF294 nucleotidyltransferase-like domain-containing protein [Methyloligellaceae bacterium]
MLEVQSRTPLMSVDAVALDTETTGLNPQESRVIQLGAVKVCNGALLEDRCFDELVNPGVPIPQVTIDIHHITDADVRDVPAFGEAAPAFDRFCGVSVALGHNIGFDLAILQAEFERAGLIWTRPRSLDTLVLTRIVNPVLPDFGLDTIADWLEIEIAGRHNALGDSLATARVFLKLVPMLRAQGIRTLAEAEKASRSFADVASRHAESGWVQPVREAHEAQAASAALARVDCFPYRHRVCDVMSTPPLTVEPDCTLKRAAGLLAERGTSSAFVELGPSAEAWGIVTERDLMRALAAATDDGETVGAIMSTPLETITDEAFVYQAIAQMTRKDFRHLGVCDGSGVVIGALASGDLLRQRAHDALILGDEITHAESVTELGAIWARLPAVARSMLGEGIGAREIAAVIAEELCALTARAASLAAADMRADGRGEPPCAYSLLVLGSGGRGESLLVPDQDNALIYEIADAEGHVDRWFEELGVRLTQILDDVGVPFCNGGVMARSAEWRRSAEDWTETVRGWLARAEPKDLFYVDNFFDFRVVAGAPALGQELSETAYQLAGSAPGFLRNLAAIATNVRPPIGLFGQIVAENGRVDLKRTALIALVGGARVLALRHGVARRATKDRLEGVRPHQETNPDDIDSIIRAHELILREILRQQLEDIEAGIPPSNKVALKRLSKHERAELKWALQQIEVMISAVGDPQAFG